MKYQARSILPAACLMALLALSIAGCGGGCCLTPPTDVTGKDNNVFVPSVRIAWEARTASPGSPPSQPHGGHAVEFNASKGTGNSSQTLNSNQQPIEFAGVRFVPPQVIQENFDFFIASISYRWRKFFNRSWGFELLAGAGYCSTDSTLDSGAQHARLREAGVCAPLGFGMIWNPGEKTSVQARITGGGGKGGSFAAYEIAVAQAIAEHVALRAGWVRWDWNPDNNGVVTAGSYVQFTFSGPTLGLSLEF